MKCNRALWTVTILSLALATRVGSEEATESSESAVALTFEIVARQVGTMVEELPPENLAATKRTAAALVEVSRRGLEKQARVAEELSERQIQILSSSRERLPASHESDAGQSHEGTSSRDLQPVLPAIGPAEQAAETTPVRAVQDDSGVLSDAGTAESAGLTRAEREVLVAHGARSFARSLAEAAEAFDLRPAFLLCVMRIESDFEPRAVSRVGAIGLMQLMPATAAGLGANPWDLSENITGGARLIDELLKRHEEDVTLAMAAYNAGPGAVAKHGGIPPYPETRNYVARVAAECPDPRP